MTLAFRYKGLALIQTCPNNNPEYYLHTPSLNNMAPKPAASASATAKPTASAAPTSSRPSTPNTAAKVNDLALADEEIYKDVDTDKLVNGLVDKRKADLETCM